MSKTPLKKIIKSKIKTNKELTPQELLRERIKYEIADELGLKEKEMDEVAEFIKRVAVDKENIKDEVREFMDQYTTVHYSFSQNEGYRFHKL